MATTQTWTATLNLPLRSENTNYNDSITNVTMEVFVSAVYRLGELNSRPSSYTQSGTTAGVVLKYSAGNLRSVIISSVTQNANVTLYANTAASGTILWSSGEMGSQTIPLALDFQSVQFSTGLTLVISGANCNATIIYE